MSFQNSQFPPIEQSLSPKRSGNLFGKSIGLSQSQSASTLQHGTIAWGFSKASRFPSIKTDNEFSKYIDLPSTLNKRSTTLGFGHKIVMSEVNSKFAKDYPSPDRYNLTYNYIDKAKGKTFGMPHSCYAKVHLEGSNLVTPEIAKDYPGPGQYTHEIPIGSNKQKVSLKARGKMFNEFGDEDTPSANYYSPSYALVSPGKSI